MIAKTLLIFCYALVLTILIEAVVCLGLKPWLYKTVKTAELMVAMLLCNVITNPTLNVIRFVFEFESLGFETILLECAATIVETVLYRLLLGKPLWKAILLSVVCNTVSYCAGLLIQAVF